MTKPNFWKHPIQYVNWSPSHEEDEPKPEAPNGTKRINYYFDNDLGAMAYGLEEYTLDIRAYIYGCTYRYWKTLSSEHDLAWAKRIARQYKIEVPDV